MRLDLTVRPQARRDLKDIWRYTEKTWSRAQANRYVAKLESAISQLRERPQLGRPSDDISPGLLRRAAERHVIYFRIRDGRLIVVRVLHERMNAPAHLANDEA